ncbi:hypothetical protein R3Q06_33575 [Rhodococcus erythropolis]|nr:hypothetical protein [Rhodococcus erythropolis]MDV6278132.1 hypothetical protein [Rhodococcus erythropolis]MDV6278364.1 hypothetical protein [Rhodococcus erythropolis]
MISKSFSAAYQRLDRRCMTATDHRTELATRFQVWDQVPDQALAA